MTVNALRATLVATLFATLFATLVTPLACGRGDAARTSNANPGNAGSGAAGARAPAVGNGGPPVPTGVLPAGTVIHAMIVNPLSSLADKPGGLASAVVHGDVFGPAGGVVIPSGSPLDLRIVRLEAVGSGAKATARVELVPVAVHAVGITIPLAGTVDSMAYLARGNNIIIERATPLTVHLSIAVKVAN